MRLILNFSSFFFRSQLTTLIVFASILGISASCEALEKTSSSGKASTAVSKTLLHRFDFRLEGASCATCLLKIRAALRQTKGVANCEMALRKPYGGVVIYRASDIDVKKISAIMVKADPRSTVVVKDQVDETIAKMPLLLIPKYTSLLPKSE